MCRALWWSYGEVMFLMSEVPLYKTCLVQGYLAHKKQGGTSMSAESTSSTTSALPPFFPILS